MKEDKSTTLPSWKISGDAVQAHSMFLSKLSFRNVRFRK